jgi:hypothetical protein
MRPPVARPSLLAALALSSLAFPAASLVAQYPLAPSPVLSLDRLTAAIDLSGYLSMRETVREDTAAFTVNRARITLQIRPAPYAAVRLQGDLAAIGRARSDTVPAFALTDAYLQLGPADSARGATEWLRPALLVGQFKTPFSLEYLTSFSALLTADRSRAVDRLATRRDLGVLGTLSAGRWATVWAAVTNGEGANATGNPDARQLAVGRLGVYPARSLALGGKWANQGSDQRWGLDARWMARDVVAEGELLRRSSPEEDGTRLDGRGGYALVALGTVSWLQPVVKWERLRTRTTSGATATDVRETFLTYGINLLAAGGRLRLQLDYVDAWASSDDPRDKLIAQLQAIF